MPLATLDQVKRQLNISLEDTHDDEELADHLEAVAPVVEGIVGPVDDRTVVEHHDGGGGVLALGVTPARTVTAVTAPEGEEVVDASRVLVVPGTGRATLPGGVLWPRDVLVAYTAGRGGEPPANVRMAALIIVQHLWRLQRGRGSARVYGDSPDEDTVTVPGAGFAVPRRAWELLRPDDRGPVVG